MRSLWKVFTILSILFILLKPANPIFSINTCPTDDPCRDKTDPFDKVNCYRDVVSICSTQRESMVSQVTYLSTKIQLTTLKIEQNKSDIKKLEEEIGALSQKIDNLETSLTTITGMFIDRITASYKTGGSTFLNLILDSSKFSDLFNRYKYIQTVQAHDRKLLFQMQNSKLNFEEQKSLREEKKQALSLLKKQLEKEEVTLAVQKKEKEIFLAVTQNNENIYKQNLEAARREASEIQQAASILSKAGVAKHVSRGEVIGIMGNTGYSTGPHLHLAVYNLKEADLNKFNFDSGYENPFSNLSVKEVAFYAGSCDDIPTDKEFTLKTIGSGSWSWPMNNPKISQCYGHTPASNAYYRSGIHNGVDMVNKIDTLVRAIDDGNSYTFWGGCSKGNGVFIFHPNGKMTLYWHLCNPEDVVNGKCRKDACGK